MVVAARVGEARVDHTSAADFLMRLVQLPVGAAGLVVTQIVSLRSAARLPNVCTLHIHTALLGPVVDGLVFAALREPEDKLGAQQENRERHWQHVDTYKRGSIIVLGRVKEV